MKPRPVYTSDGRRFGSQTAASRSLRVSASRISQAVAEGIRAGGRWWSSRPVVGGQLLGEATPGLKARPIYSSDGRGWINAGYAGEILGVSGSTITSSLARGRRSGGLRWSRSPFMGSVAEPLGSHLKGERRDLCFSSDRRVWINAKYAAWVMGVSRSAISEAIRSPGRHCRGLRWSRTPFVAAGVQAAA